LHQILVWQVPNGMFYFWFKKLYLVSQGQQTTFLY
jgi:hypothetical protein